MEINSICAQPSLSVPQKLVSQLPKVLIRYILESFTSDLDCYRLFHTARCFTWLSGDSGFWHQLIKRDFSCVTKDEDAQESIRTSALSQTHFCYTLYKALRWGRLTFDSASLNSHTNIVCKTSLFSGHLVSASFDRTLRMWDRNNEGQMEASTLITNPEAPITNFSVDSRHGLIVSGWNDRVRLWKQQDDDLIELAPLIGHGDVIKDIIINNGWIVSASLDRTVRVWKPLEGDKWEIVSILRGHRDTINSIAFNPTNRTIVSASSDCTIGVWACQNDRWFKFVNLMGHTDQVNSVAIDSTDQMIVSGSNDCTAGVWKLQGDSWILDAMLPHKEAVNSVAIDSLKQWIVSAADDCHIYVWIKQGDGWSLLSTLAGHQGPVNTVSIHPDMALIVSGSQDHTIRIWRPNLHELIQNVIDVRKRIQA